MAPSGDRAQQRLRRPARPVGPRPAPRRRTPGFDPFSAAMRPVRPRRPSLRDRLLAGEFQTRFVVLLGVTMLAVVIVAVLR